MSKKVLTYVFIFIFLLGIIFMINPGFVFAADVTVSGITYNENDYTKLKAFLNLNSTVAGKTNGKMLNSAYDENNPVTWSGVTWSSDTVKRIEKISWSRKSLAGTLDLSEAISLTSLYCDSNGLTTLDVSKNPALTYLACYSNNLTALNVNDDIKLANLYCQANQLTTLQVGSNTALQELHCDSNKLTELNLSTNTALTYLRCYSNQLSELKVDSNTALTKLVCDSNKLTEMDISKNLLLNYLACYSNQLSALDVSANVNLVYLYCQANQLSELKVNKNTALKELHCNSNQLKELDVSANEALTYLRCYSNQLSELKLDKNTTLSQLACQLNKLTVLDVSNNKALTYLACYSNQLSELDVSNSNALTALYCQLNKLTTLDVSNNVLLTELHCYSNQLTSLNTTLNTNLKNIWCYSNKLNTLDVSKSTELFYLNCSNNNLQQIIANVSNKNISVSSNGNGYVELFKNATFKFYVVAVPQTDNKFANWMQAGAEVSEDLTYNLNAGTNYYLKANFSQDVVFVDSLDGSHIAEQTLDFNSAITAPAAPTKEGYIFGGWYKEATCINVWDFATDVVTEDITLYAKWEDVSPAETYTVTFNVNGGSIVPDITNITSGCAIAAPAAPTKEGYMFGGWHKEATCINVWDFATDVVTEDITLYAKWEDVSPTETYTVTFNVNGGIIVPDITNITSGCAITAPAVPTKEGYIFGGWYKEATCINVWDFATDVVTEDITLYAKWEDVPPAETYAVTFNVNGGSVVLDITNITSGSAITAPAVPMKEEYMFGGWYKEATCINVWDFATDVVTEDITLYAKWEDVSPAETYTVTFNVNGGSIVPDITNITSGCAITAPAATTKEGYMFGGWYKEATCINVWDFATEVVTADITLYAEWIAKNESRYNVTNTQQDNYEIIINGKTEIVARIDTEIVGSETVTTVKVNNLKIIEILEREGRNSKIIIPIINISGNKVIEIKGQAIKNLEVKASTIEIKTDNATYVLKASEINIDKVSQEIGSSIELKDIVVKITIGDSSEEVQSLVKATATQYNCKILTKPVEFEITCTSGGQTVAVSRFNSYVERTIAIPDGIDPSKITTGVEVNKDGTFSHVPTTIVVINGKYYAKISILTNSTYTVIWNPVTFKDIENHWAKSYVNEIGSRLIDSGIGDGSFAPNRAITRAEFVSMIVKALGLKGTNFPDKFSDVKKDNPYYYYIYTAYEFGILTGYPNGKFGENDLITREQAMTMLARAMKIAGMNVSVSLDEIADELKLFKDSGSISSYAKEGATICVVNGIFGGYQGNITPKDNFTRAESAKVIIKLLEKAELI